MKNTALPAVILAGGFGTRLVGILGDRPKVLVEVGGKTILERQIDFLGSCGINRIRLSLHHKADEIIEYCRKKWGARIEFRVEPEPLGTGGALLFAARDIAGEFLVLNGDILFSDFEFPEFLSLGAPAMACKKIEDARSFGLVKIEENSVVEFLEKPKEPAAGYVNCGMYLWANSFFEGIDKKFFMLESDVFPKLAEDRKLKPHIHKGFWIDIGTEERYNEARQAII